VIREVEKINNKTSIQYSELISATELKKHLTILASDSLEGRETTKPGQKKAAEYIRKHFINLGLKPPVAVNDTFSYYQTFELIESSWGKDIYITHNNKKYNFIDDFFCFSGARTQKPVKQEFVFCGYGIDDENFSDFTQKDVKGKLILILEGEPKFTKSSYSLKKKNYWTLNWRSKLIAAKNKGATGIIHITGLGDYSFIERSEMSKHYFEQSALHLPEELQEEEKDFSSIFISPEMGADLLGLSVSDLKKYVSKVNKKCKPLPIKSSYNPELTLNIERNFQKVSTENVLGFLEGTDKKDELIVLTAHYDHIGIIDGDIYNGADDDGSGTAAVLQIAAAFANASKDGFRPRRSILFMPVTGEEKGLLGSKYYSENPVFPISNTIANLNTDMIGRIDSVHRNNPNYIYLIGSDKLSTELHAISEDMNNTFTHLLIDYTFNDPDDPNRFYYRSDHYNFAQKGIPIIFYFNGVHEDYHQPGDEVQKINFDKMEKITRLIFHTAWELANREKRIVADKLPKTK
ncbi:MAG: hypothetical protein A3H98_01185, partial [Bacteroidetes bacterium RIFCSPLOWO2_02_FULL_36_8]